MTKPARWHDPAHKLFPYQVGFTAPPKDWDAAPSDFLRISPPTVGVHGRLLHAADYAHTLDQRAARRLLGNNITAPCRSGLHRANPPVRCTLRAHGEENVSRDQARIGLAPGPHIKRAHVRCIGFHCIAQDHQHRFTSS